MNTKSLAKSNTVQTYADLLKRVRGAIREGKERAFAAVERESVRTKWEVGKLILEHILLNKTRAGYGQQVIKRLSVDLGVSKTELNYRLEFARTEIVRPGGQLSWGHHQALLRINESDEREKIAREAVEKKWTKKVLSNEITKRKAARQITVSKAPVEERLVPRKGTLDTYRIITAKAGPWTGELALDLGFANYHLPANGSVAGKPLADRLPFRDKEIVGASSGKLTRVKEATDRDLFTYRAYLLQVTDADTLWVLVDLGFGFITQQQLRLRGIDAPEMTSRLGQEAKQFVERELKRASRIIITTTQSDKYDRYLADVFYTVKGTEHFLNNRLLDRGLAQRV